METFVLFHVRCQTCSKVLGNKQFAYEKLIEGDPDAEPPIPPVSPKEALDRLGLTRYCCRMRALNAPRFVHVFVATEEEGLTRPPGSISEGIREQQAEISKLRQQIGEMTIAQPIQLPAGGALLAMQNSQPIHAVQPTQPADVFVGASPALQLPAGGAFLVMQNSQPIHAVQPTQPADVFVGASPATVGIQAEPQLVPLTQPGAIEGLTTIQPLVGGLPAAIPLGAQPQIVPQQTQPQGVVPQQTPGLQIAPGVALPMTMAGLQQVTPEQFQPVQPIQTGMTAQLPLGQGRPGQEQTTQLGAPRMARVFQAV